MAIIINRKFRQAIFSVVAAIVASVTCGISAPMQAEVLKEELKLNGSSVSVPAYSWVQPSAKPVAVLLAIHGGVQHAGSYSALAEELAGRGIIVYSIDLRGHGAWLEDNTARRHLDYSASTADVTVLSAQLRALHAGLPLFCIGESLGAAVALHASYLKPKLFDGLILSSPGTHPVVTHDFGSLRKSIHQGVKTLGRTIDIAPFLTRMSEDPRSCQEMICDPRNRNVASVRDLLHMRGFVGKNCFFARALDPQVPVLVLQGSEDRICDARSARSVFERFSSCDKSMKLFDGCGHLIVTTKYLKPVVVQTVESWLLGHAGAYASTANTAKSAEEIHKAHGDETGSAAPAGT